MVAYSLRENTDPNRLVVASWGIDSVVLLMLKILHDLSILEHDNSQGIRYLGHAGLFVSTVLESHLNKVSYNS